MKQSRGKVVVTVLLTCILAALIVLFVFKDQVFGSNEPEVQEFTPHTEIASVQTIKDSITGTAEIKTTKSERIKPKAWKTFKAFLVPLNTRIAAGTPLVEYADGQTFDAPYDLVVHSYDMPEKKDYYLTEEHGIEVSRVDVLKVELKVHENDIKKLAVGQSAEVILGSDESKVFSGTVSSINEVGTYDAAGSKYTVTIDIVNDGTVLIGMSADVEIVIGEATDVLTVPVGAINDTQGAPFVLVLREDGSVEPVDVETGLSDGVVVEIKSGLSEGDKVVVPESSGNNNSDMPEGAVVMDAGSMSVTLG